MKPYIKGLTLSLIGLQMLFVAFGALVLVPILTGLDPNVALFTAGLGTLIFQVITRFQVPIFLASSFAFIAPIIYGTNTWGLSATLGGMVAAGGVYVLLSLIVRYMGINVIHKILPPIVVGPVIMVIGLSLAPTAVHMAMGQAGDGKTQLIPKDIALTISLTAFLVTILTAVFARGLFRLFTILSGILAGYAMALILGQVDFTSVTQAAVFSVPHFRLPTFRLEAILFIIPVAIAPAIEHIGDMFAISKVTGIDYVNGKPGLKKTLLGDGIATMAAAFLGGPPNTTYSEVTGAVTITRAFNPFIMTFAAIFAIILSFFGTLGAVLHSIPIPVMGGIMVLLFGTIAVIGMNTLVHARLDLLDPRNLVIASVILVVGIGGLNLGYGHFQLEGIGLSAVIGILLNLLLNVLFKRKAPIHALEGFDDNGLKEDNRPSLKK